MAERFEVVEYTDPFCIWAWGTEPKLDRLRESLGSSVRWRTVIGILFDGQTGDGDPVAQLERWQDVARHTGAPLPERLEWAPHSSWIASRAVKAAGQQSDELATLVLRRLRESAFSDGRPADDEARIADVLADVPELDLPRLLAALDDPAVVALVQADWEETRNPLADVIGLTEPEPHPGAAAVEGDRLRYRFPTLVFRGSNGVVVVPGWREYGAYATAAGAVGGRAAIVTAS